MSVRSTKGPLNPRPPHSRRHHEGRPAHAGAGGGLVDQGELAGVDGEVDAGGAAAGDGGRDQRGEDGVPPVLRKLRLYAAARGSILVSISSPASMRAMARSYSACRFSQNCGVVPNRRARRSAIRRRSARR